METPPQDPRYAFCQIARGPGFSAVAVIPLALVWARTVAFRCE